MAEYFDYASPEQFGDCAIAMVNTVSRRFLFYSCQDAATRRLSPKPPPAAARR